jgi:4-hydroxy-2-oxoheptanedioate aldolase
VRDSVIKRKLARGEPVLLTQLHFTDPSVFELTSLMGFDGIWMDLEHHTYSAETAANLIRAARVGNADVVARAGKGEFARLSRLLEAGAHGIMYPRCDDAEEAAQVVNWAKFAPLGKRGYDGGNPDMPYCSMAPIDYIKYANDQTFVVIQIEEMSVIKNVDAIAEVPGVDVLFLGPADFAVLEGIPGQIRHPKVLKALESMAAAARKAGKHVGTPAVSLDHAKQLLDMGVTFICYSADLVMVKQGLERIQLDFAKLGFTFNSRLPTGQDVAAS